MGPELLSADNCAEPRAEPRADLWRRRAALWAFKWIEALIAALAFVVAAGVSTAGSPGAVPVAASVPWATPPLGHGSMLLVSVLIFHASFLMRGLYASHRLESPHQEQPALALALLVVTGLLTLLLVFFDPALAQATFVAVFFALALGLLLLERRLLRLLLRRLHGRGRHLRFALLVGSGERAMRLARTLGSREELGYRVVGCVDDAQPAAGSGLHWLGGLDALSEVLSNNVVDEVFIALPMRSSYERIQQAVLRCEEQGALVTMPADFFAARLARTRFGRLDEQPVLYLSSVPENDWRLVAKRCIDVSAALGLLLLLSPVLLAVALAVSLSGPGPIIFKQLRIGLNKRPFMLYKFRTMVQDAEALQAGLESANEVSGPVFKIRKDPRVTALGRFLRRSSLDELPQLLNVLRGHMSLVGPRPLPLRDVKGFNQDWARRRFSVLPGITCLWQLGGRSDVSFDQWMAMDLEYIDHWSLRLDMSILVRTAGVVLRPQGAY